MPRRLNLLAYSFGSLMPRLDQFIQIGFATALQYGAPDRVPHLVRMRSPCRKVAHPLTELYADSRLFAGSH